LHQLIRGNEFDGWATIEKQDCSATDDLRLDSCCCLGQVFARPSLVVPSDDKSIVRAAVSQERNGIELVQPIETNIDFSIVG
jgi:hypothetical protein